MGALVAIGTIGWTVYTYRKARTGKPVLDIETQAAWEQQNSTWLIQIRVVLSNTGKSKIELVPTGTGVLVSIMAASASPSVTWPAPIAARSLVGANSWLEPGEKKRVDLLIDSGRCAVGVAQLKTRVVYQGPGRKHLEDTTEIVCTSASTIK